MFIGKWATHKGVAMPETRGVEAEGLRGEVSNQRERRVGCPERDEEIPSGDETSAEPRDQRSTGTADRPCCDPGTPTPKHGGSQGR